MLARGYFVNFERSKHVSAWCGSYHGLRCNASEPTTYKDA